MTIQIVRWGNSQGVRLPKALLDSAGLAAGDMAELRLEDGRIIIERMPQQRMHRTLEERVQSYGKKLGPYTEYDWGEPVGKEVW